MLGALLAVTAVTYAPSWTHPFHFDDHHSIANNPYIRDPANIPKFYASRRLFSVEQIYAGHYRPVLLTTYALNYAADGSNPRGYHLVNVAVHLAVVAGVYALALAWQASPAGALAAAALMAWHPLTSEAVLYVSARSTMLMTLGMLWAVVAAFARWGSRQGPAGGLGWLAVFWGATVVALGSKEVAVVLPVVVAAALALRDGRAARWGACLREGLLPLGVAVAAFVVFTGASSYLAGVARGEGVRSLGDTLLSQPVVWAKTLGLFAMPMGLSAAHHVPPPTTIADGRVLVGGAVAVIVLAAGAALVRAGAPGRRIAWAIVWVAAAFAPTAFASLSALFLEHRAYLPVAGLCLAVGWGVAWGGASIGATWAVRASVTAALVIALAAAWWGTIERIEVWRDDVSLWGDAVAKAPEGPVGHNNLAVAYGRLGRWDEAFAHYEAAGRLAPDDPLILANLGGAYERVGDDQRAEAVYRRGAATWPRDGWFLFALAVLYERRGNAPAAIDAYREGLRANPNRAGAYGNLGNLYLRFGQWTEARDAYQRATAVDSQDFRTWYNFGLASERLGDLQIAEEAYGRATALAPGEARIVRALDALRARRGTR